MGQPWPLICLFLSFSQHNDKYSTQFDYKWKNLTLSAWDSNPGWWMVGYGSKAASKHTKFFLGMVFNAILGTCLELSWHWKINGFEGRC